jgi:hypothetical protein
MYLLYLLPMQTVLNMSFFVRPDFIQQSCVGSNEISISYVFDYLAHVSRHRSHSNHVENDKHASGSP